MIRRTEGDAGFRSAADRPLRPDQSENFRKAKLTFWTAQFGSAAQGGFPFAGTLPARTAPVVRLRRHRNQTQKLGPLPTGAICLEGIGGFRFGQSVASATASGGIRTICRPRLIWRARTGAIFEMTSRAQRFSAPYDLTTREARLFGRTCRALGAHQGTLSEETVLLVADWVTSGSRIVRLHVIESMTARKGAEDGATRLLQLSREITEATRLRMGIAKRLRLGFAN